MPATLRYFLSPGLGRARFLAGVLSASGLVGAEAPGHGRLVALFDEFTDWKREATRSDLGRFHDRIMRPGHIPAALPSWEPTGLDDEIETLRASQPLDESNK